MPNTVIVSFARDREYEFKFFDSDKTPFTPEQAHAWLDQEWNDLDCVPTNPMGKVLRLDKVLLIAQYAGEKRFVEAGAWANNYARAVLAVLGRDTVNVDIAERAVS